MLRRNILFKSLKNRTLKYVAPLTNPVSHSLYKNKLVRWNSEKGKNEFSVNASNIRSVRDGLNLLEDKFSVMREDNIAFLLRVLSVHINGGNKNEISRSINSGKMKFATNKLFSKVDSFGLGTISNVMIYLRKLRLFKINHGINNYTLIQLEKRIERSLRNDKLDLNFVTSVFFDSKAIGMSTDYLVRWLTVQARKDRSQFTETNLVQIFKGATSDIQKIRGPERFLCNMLIETNGQQFLDFDASQRASFFLYMCKLQLHINLPKYFFPHLLNKISLSLEDDLGELSSMSVLDITQAFLYVPKYFKKNLLLKIKLTFGKLIGENDQIFDNNFLIRFLYYLCELRVSDIKDTEELIYDILDIFIERIESRDPSIISRSPRYCEILCKHSINCPELAEVLLELNCDGGNNFYPHPFVMEYIALHGIDLSPIVDEITSINYGRTPSFMLLRLIQLLNVQPNLNFCFGVDQSDDITTSSISFICQSPFIDYEDDELKHSMINSLRTKNDFSNFGIVKSSLYYYKSFREENLELFESQISEMRFNAMRSYITAYFKDYTLTSNIYVFKFLVKILSINTTKINFQHFYNQIIVSSNFGKFLADSEEAKQIFENQIVELIKEDMELITLSKLQSHLSICMKLAENNVYIDNLIDLMQNNYEMVIEKYNGVNPGFMLKFSNFMRIRNKITNQQLKQVMDLLSKAERPNLNIMEMFMTSSIGVKKSNKKVANFLGRNQPVNQDSEGFLGLEEESVCLNKIKMVLKENGVEYEEDYKVGSLVCPIFLKEKNQPIWVVSPRNQNRKFLINPERLEIFSDALKNLIGGAQAHILPYNCFEEKNFDLLKELKISL